MAEPARKLPPDQQPNDPDVFYIHGAAAPDEPKEDEEVADIIDEEPELVAEENQEPDYDLRPQLEEQQRQEQEAAKKPAEIEKPPVQEPPPPAGGQEPPQENPGLAEKRREKAEEAADKVKSGEQKLKKATQGEGKVGGEIKKAAGQEAKAASRGGLRAGLKSMGESAGEIAQQAGKKLAAQAEKLATQFIAKNPYVLGALAIILIVVLIFAIVFAFFAFSGEGGKGPAKYPETAIEHQQSNFLLAISGDKVATDTVVKEVIEAELARYDRIKLNADTFDPEFSAAVAAKKAEIDTALNAVLVEQDLTIRRTLIDAATATMRDFEATLPFGEWIAAIAERSVGQPNLEFCTITGATATRACASFTSTVMYSAGLPNAIVDNTTAVWKNSALRVVIDRSPTPDRAVYDESQLQRGDIIWWGNGSCSSVKYNGKLFDHVGFYVGGDMAVDTSSGSEKVEKRSALSRDRSGNPPCLLFNGAKRYGR